MVKFSSSRGSEEARINWPSVLARFVTAELTFLKELSPLEKLVKDSTAVKDNCMPSS